jgi:hypothetical protein
MSQVPRFTGFNTKEAPVRPQYRVSNKGPRMAKPRRKHETEPDTLKLTGAGLQPEQHGPYHLTFKFGDDTFCRVALRSDAKPSEVAARLRKLGR